MMKGEIDDEGRDNSGRNPGMHATAAKHTLHLNKTQLVTSLHNQCLCWVFSNALE